jgi:hypothetical protein
LAGGSVSVLGTPVLRDWRASVTAADIFLPMGLLALSLAPTALLAAAATTPTPAQIRAAVARGEKSADLWATVNACNLASTHPKGEKLIGVRVQMPGLGFASHLYMAIDIEYWNQAKKRFLKTNSHYGLKSFGIAIRAPRQSGVSFAFTPPPAGSHYVLRGVATLEWRIGTRVLGRVVRNTGHGYHHVDFSQPPGFNAATCTISP